jgi:hypothetical protein
MAAPKPPVEERPMDLLILIGALAFATVLVWKVLGGGRLRAWLRRGQQPQAKDQSRAA